MVDLINSELFFGSEELDNEFREKWNVSANDFGCLYKNGAKVSDTLYRLGDSKHNCKNEYCLLLKQIESLSSKYDWNINECVVVPYLAQAWCIVNSEGVEMAVFNKDECPVLIGGVVYSVNGAYFNILNKSLYCSSLVCLISDDFVFLENRYDVDQNMRGVIKICKADGTYCIFKNAELDDSTVILYD